MKIFPTAEEFKKNSAKAKKQHVWAEISSDQITPVSAMLALEKSEEYCFLFESVIGGGNINQGRARYSIIGLGANFVFEIKNANKNKKALAELKKLIRETAIPPNPDLPPMASGLFGYIGYDAVRMFENIPDSNPDELGIPDALLFSPKALLIFDSVKDTLFIIVPTEKKTSFASAKNTIFEIMQKLQQPARKIAAKKYKPIKFASNCTRAEFYEMVNRSKEYIKAGDAFQLVPSQRFTSEFNLPPFAFYRSLRRLNPSPYLFFLKLKNFHIIGSSPEVLVRLRDGKVTIRPLAGTRKRGKNAAEDKALAKDLLADKKELAEHLMLLDLGRNDVGRVAKGGSVKVTEKMVVEYYSHVMHISSNVEGDIAKGFDAVDALAAGFPAGTVSGAPKIRAMEIIDELEKTKRKFYAGAVGYFSGDAMDSAITLRTALLKDGKIYLQSGVGVVLDSDPEAEYQESLNKAKALMKAAELAKDFV